jgi:hypothetical protein
MSSEDDPVALAAEIAAEKAKGAAAYEEIERLQRERGAAPSFADARALDERIEESRWIIEHTDSILPALEVRHAEAMWRTNRNAFVRHQAALAKNARGLMKILREAAQANASTIRAFEAASTDLGAHVADSIIGRYHFMGLCLPDLVETFCREMERRLAALDRAELPRPKPAPPPAARRARPYTVEELAPVQFEDRLYLGSRSPVAPKAGRAAKTWPAAARSAPRASSSHGTAGAPHPIGLENDQAVGPQHPRNPDDTEPLAPGEVRVRVLRAGFSPADEAQQCDARQVIRMPRAAADRALTAGVVEIVEQEVTT